MVEQNVGGVASAGVIAQSGVSATSGNVGAAGSSHPVPVSSMGVSTVIIGSAPVVASQHVPLVSQPAPLPAAWPAPPAARVNMITLTGPQVDECRTSLQSGVSPEDGQPGCIVASASDSAIHLEGGSGLAVPVALLVRWALWGALRFLFACRRASERPERSPALAAWRR